MFISENAVPVDRGDPKGQVNQTIAEELSYHCQLCFTVCYVRYLQIEDA